MKTCLSHPRSDLYPAVEYLHSNQIKSRESNVFIFFSLVEDISIPVKKIYLTTEAKVIVLNTYFYYSCLSLSLT